MLETLPGASEAVPSAIQALPAALEALSADSETQLLLKPSKMTEALSIEFEDLSSSIKKRPNSERDDSCDSEMRNIS